MRPRVLGIDLGLKRTGFAISDGLGLSVRALETEAPKKSRDEEVDSILAKCRELEASVIVIGLPAGPDGKESPIGRRAKGLKSALEAKIAGSGSPIIVRLEDESYSSKNAMTRLIDSGIKKEKRKALLDSEVARILVEQFIASNPGSNE